MKKLLKVLGIVSEEEMKKELAMLRLAIFDQSLEIAALNRKVDSLETTLSALSGEVTELKKATSGN